MVLMFHAAFRHPAVSPRVQVQRRGSRLVLALDCLELATMEAVPGLEDEQALISELVPMLAQTPAPILRAMSLALHMALAPQLSFSHLHLQLLNLPITRLEPSRIGIDTMISVVAVVVALRGVRFAVGAVGFRCAKCGNEGRGHFPLL
jgi:hypothetical protein